MAETTFESLAHVPLDKRCIVPARDCRQGEQYDASIPGAFIGLQIENYGPALAELSTPCYVARFQLPEDDKDYRFFTQLRTEQIVGQPAGVTRKVHEVGLTSGWVQDAEIVIPPVMLATLQLDPDSEPERHTVGFNGYMGDWMPFHLTLKDWQRLGWLLLSRSRGAVIAQVGGGRQRS